MIMLSGWYGGIVKGPDYFWWEVHELAGLHRTEGKEREGEGSKNAAFCE